MRYLLVLAVVISACSKRQDRTWNALISAFGSAVSLDGPETFSIAYIIRQTHEPYFRMDENRQVTSKVLRHFENSFDFKSFTLCPNPEWKFSETEPFSTEDIKVSLRKLTSKLSEVTLPNVGRCVRAEFDKPKRRFYQILSNLFKSPSRVAKDPRYALGLGPFAIKSFTKDKMVLERKPWTSGRFDKIELTLVPENRRENLPEEGYEDYNLFPETWIPEKIKKEYKAYAVSNRIMGLMFIHVNDERLRKRLFHCADIPALNSFYQSYARPPLETANLFPIGIRGARPGPPVQNCPPRPMKYTGKPLRMLNMYPALQAQLAGWAAGLTKRTGIPIEVVETDGEGLTKFVAEDKSGYDVAFIASGSDDSEPAAHLEAFLGKSKVYRYTPRAWDLEYEQILEIENTAERERRAIEMGERLLKAAVALPLGQGRKMLYYPKDLSMPLGGNAFEFPEVDKIQ